MGDLEERFEGHVDRIGEHHIWIGAKDPERGTGRVKVAGRSTAAHRVAWELAHGPIPTGARVLPCAADPACVRVDHLRQEGGSAPARKRAPKGAGSMREVVPGVWKLAATAKSTTARGTRRVYKTVRASSRSEATRALATFVADLRGAAPVPAPAVYNATVDETIEVFLVEHLLGEKGREPRTIYDYRQLHAKWFSSEIGHRLVRDVDEPALDAAFGRMRAAGLSRSRMNQAKSLYRPFFRWATKRGLAVRNPMADFQLPTSTYVSSERTPPEADELCILLGAAVEVVPDVAPLLVLGAATGMRRGELVGIRRSRIHPRQQRITVDAAVDGKRVKSTKTHKERSLFVDEETMAMLIRLGRRQDEMAAQAGISLVDDPFLFTQEPDASTPLPPDTLTKRVAVLKEHLGIADKRPETIEREDEALRLYKAAAPSRPAGKPGPAPSGSASYADIGAALGRSDRWAVLAVRSAQRRASAKSAGRELDFDGSVLALRKFTSTELLDAGFNISMVAQRQGHGTQVLAKHYAKGRRSADRNAASHLGRVIHHQR
jgi:integrase